MVDWTDHTSRIINRLGRPVSITPFGGALKVVNADFVSPPASAFNMLDGNNPTLRLTSQDAVGIKNGDPVSVDAVSYTVYRLHADPVAGDVVIELEAV